MNTEYYTNNFQEQCCPFCYNDMKQAIDWIAESKINSEETPDATLWEIIENFNDSCGLPKNTLETERGTYDICGMVLDEILQYSRGKIEELTGKDIQNDLSVDVHYNFLCSQYTINGDWDETLEFLNSIETEDETVKWFIEFIN